jgi:transcriptional regulator with XRE-family HTH domain
MQESTCDIVDLFIPKDFKEMDTRFVISRNVRNRRLACGLTQSRLGAVVNYSNVWICHVENGRASIPAECMPAIANALDTTIEDLYKPRRFYVED